MSKYGILTIALLLFASCFNDKPTSTKPIKETKPVLFKLVSPQQNKVIKLGENMEVEVQAIDNRIADSCMLSINGKNNCSFKGNKYSLFTEGLRVGTKRISLKIFYDSITETVDFTVRFIPNKAPVQYGVKVMKEYSHDVKAYTQGLFYHNGFVYEGTGQNGKSSLRKVELETGKVVKKTDLDYKYFGEGICLHNNKIYQLTWQNRKGFVYNFDDFGFYGEFAYSTEGWGITSDGKNLWMTDGSSSIYKLNADNMSVVDQIEAFSDAGAVSQLNELEYINGEIWANVYGEDYIVRIDTLGVVKGVIDLTGILRSNLITTETDVLNGIAYDKDRDRIFVTGKNWPLLFEIKIFEK